MRKIWLIFAQATTVALAALLVVQTLRPDLLPARGSGGVVTITESGAHGRGKEPAAARATGSYSGLPEPNRKRMPSSPACTTPS